MSEVSTEIATSPLEEQARRRHNWSGGEPIEMNDGQEWFIPPPVICPDGREGWECHLGLLGAIHDAAEGGRGRELLEVAAAATIQLLQRHYDLTAEEAAGLLPPFEAADPGPRWRAIIEILSGRRRERTLDRWLRVTLLANGINGPLDLADAWDAADFLEATGRTVPRRKWVDEFREEDDASNVLGAMM